MNSQFTKNIPLYLLAALCLGVVSYSVKLGIGSLYAKAAENELHHMPVSLNEEGAENAMQLKQQFVERMLSWNPDSPQNLLIAGYFQSYMGWLTSDPSLTGKAMESMQYSAEQRPLWPESYIQRAYLLANTEASPDAAIAMLNKASAVGPYEGSTAEAIMRIYFSKWDQLSAPDRILASRVVLNAGEHGVGYWELRKFISGFSHKERVCNLLKFNGIYNKECQ